MKAVVYDNCGPPEVLRCADIPPPALGKSDVRIRVEAISVEGGDLRRRRVVQPPHPSYVPGYQAAGFVEEVGPLVKGTRIGDRVAAFNWSGSYAEYFVVPEHFAYPVPDALDIRLAAILPITSGTADDALFEVGQLQTGQTVLVHGATGGVGIATVQLAAAAGARVIATASREASYPLLRELGADAVINHATEDIVARAGKLAGPGGVDLVVDLAGGKNAPALLRTLRYRGRVALVGVASGVEPSYGFRELVPNGLSVCGVAFGREMHLPRIRQMLQRHFDAAAQGRLRIPIAAEFPMSEAARAHEYAENGGPFGRVLMLP